MHKCHTMHIKQIITIGVLKKQEQGIIGTKLAYSHVVCTYISESCTYVIHKHVSIAFVGQSTSGKGECL